MGGEASAGGAARDAGNAGALAEVELGPAAVTFEAFEHLAFGEFSFPAGFEDGVLGHGCAPVWNYGRGYVGAHRELFTVER